MATGIQGGIVEYAYPGDVLTFTVDSSASTALDGGNLVAMTTDFKVDLAGDSVADIIGVALHDAAAGEKVTVARTGVYYLKASGAINAGDLVESAALGAISAHSTTTVAYTKVIGIAYEAISDGQTGRVALRLG